MSENGNGKTYGVTLERAVALRYDGRNAPTVTAKGDGTIAEQIVAIAEENGIPIHEDPALMAVLSRLELGDEIPMALYVAVAEVIAFAYRVSDRQPPFRRE
ncbi:MAG: flagellar protein FhlB [Gammaproteobacteria bacterium]|nr:flagellar protein FhlB [Gammaproteobacteria bacterium]